MRLGRLRHAETILASRGTQGSNDSLPYLPFCVTGGLRAIPILPATAYRRLVLFTGLIGSTVRRRGRGAFGLHEPDKVREQPAQSVGHDFLLILQYIGERIEYSEYILCSPRDCDEGRCRTESLREEGVVELGIIAISLQSLSLGSKDPRIYAPTHGSFTLADRHHLQVVVKTQVAQRRLPG